MAASAIAVTAAAAPTVAARRRRNERRPDRIRSSEVYGIGGALSV
jgi:hypothetical protein